jgi:hypothetical protein
MLAAESSDERCLAMNTQNLQQTASRPARPPAGIRFSGADGKVLTWMTSSEDVRTDSRLLREVRRQPPVVAAIRVALRALVHGLRVQKGAACVRNRSSHGERPL